MRHTLFFVSVFTAFIISSCDMNENPLLTLSENPFGTPAYDIINDTDYRAAFDAAIEEAKADIQAIKDTDEEPSFENTIEALEFAGKTLTLVDGIFSNKMEACTSETLQKIAEEISPMLTEYSMSITLDPVIFQRVKSVYDKKESLNLNQEQTRLLDETYKSFVRNGANLSDEEKEELSRIAEELSLATLKFGNNALAATNAFTLNITDEDDLAGLPDYVKEMGASEAKARGEEGWTFTLNQPSYSPFMKYCDNRALREKMWMAYNSQCIGGEYDNTSIILKIVDLRDKKAKLLGYKTYADYVLEDRMAKDSETVWNFLNRLMDQSLPAAKQDVAQIQQYARENGFDDELQSWDFSYWSEKYQNEKYSINEEILKPYFSLESTQKAAFDLADRLYGLKFKERKDIPVYHPDVRTFEVTDAGGRFMAVLYMDYFPRDNKRSGAWTMGFRSQSICDGKEERPFISIVTNFSKPTEDTPALLTFYEVTTLLHEFGHALHGILAEGSYPSLTGTSVARDFVELPSQIMENWAYEPEFLTTFAKHYKTGEDIPQELIERIVDAKNFQAGYQQVRQLQFGTIDMAWHSADGVPSDDVLAFENTVFKNCTILPSVGGTSRTPTFTHIFSGGYSAGYYSYKWAEVLEADAFSLFKEKGIFNTEVSASFRDNILSRGDIEDADVLYRNFRGRDPEPDALLVKLGLK